MAVIVKKSLSLVSDFLNICFKCIQKKSLIDDKPDNSVWLVALFFRLNCVRLAENC